MGGQFKRIFTIIALAICLGTSCEAKHLAVIVEKNNSVGSLSSADLLKVFKFDRAKWPDGKNVVVVLRDPSTPEMQTAIDTIYHMQPAVFRSMLASHQNVVVIVASEDEMLKSVAAIPGAVGLVDVYSITENVKVIKVDGKLPLEQGYPLKGR
jgi:ABC-type phosphate transport system substrate-binding protein